MFALILFLCFLTEEIALLHYASSVAYARYSKKYRVIIATILYLCLFTTGLLKIGILNTILYFVLNILFIYTQYQVSLLFALFHSSILVSIMGFSELAVYVILHVSSPEALSTPGIDTFLYAILSKMLFFSIIFCISFTFKNKKTKPDYYDKIVFLLLLIPISCFFILLTLIRIIETYHFAQPLDFFVTISAILLLMITLLTFLLNQYHYKKSTDFTDIQLQLQKEDDLIQYYKMLISQNENQNILIHDIKKHLQSIDLLNENGSSREIHAYIQHLLSSTELKTSSRICDNELLNSILCRYQKQCELNHINFITDIRKETLTNISHNELTSLFCNLLDNAITACDRIPDAFIELSVQKRENSPYTTIILINSCKNAPTYDDNNLPISAKKANNRHGYGMKSISKVVKKYNGDIQTYYNTETAQFHTIITIKET